MATSKVILILPTNLSFFKLHFIISFYFRHEKDATIVLFDVGTNTEEIDESSSQTFYEQAKKCLEKIINRKVMHIVR